MKYIKKIKSESLRERIISQFPISIKEYEYLLYDLNDLGIKVILSRTIRHVGNKFTYILSTHSMTNGECIELGKFYKIDNLEELDQTVFKIKAEEITDSQKAYNFLIEEINNGNVSLEERISYNYVVTDIGVEEVTTNLVRKLNKFGYAIQQFMSIVVQYDKTRITL